MLGFTRSRAFQFCIQREKKMDDIIRPKNLAEKQAAEAQAGAAAEADAAAQEEMIQAYAAYLEQIKASDPAEYKRIVDDMMSAAPDGLKAKISRGTYSFDC